MEDRGGPYVAARRAWVVAFQSLLLWRIGAGKNYASVFRSAAEFQSLLLWRIGAGCIRWIRCSVRQRLFQSLLLWRIGAGSDYLAPEQIDPRGVSILVVVEDRGGHQFSSLYAYLESVSILVVVEDRGGLCAC